MGDARVIDLEQARAQRILPVLACVYVTETGDGALLTCGATTATLTATQARAIGEHLVRCAERAEELDRE